tara:strand:- start:295 stop:546 length:252 start_codon:yes stop_codon:yes gene_type:complete
MSKVEFAEYEAMSMEEQIIFMDKRIESARKAKRKAIENIKRFEELNENLNAQIETLLELKWNCKYQMKIDEITKEISENVFGE